MTNKQVAQVLEEIAVLLELQGENPFKARAYTNAARKIEQFEGDIADLVAEKRLREIPGLGDALERKITELVTTGRLEYLEGLRSQFPAGLFELFAIPGLGARRIRQLYEEAGVASLDALESAIVEGRLAGLRGFGARMIERIGEGIAFARLHQGQYHVDQGQREAERLCAALRDTPGVRRLSVAGSLRRRKEVIKDIDILASSTEPEALMARFTEAEGVANVTNRGDTKSGVVLKSGIAADLRVVSDEQFPFALAYFTGSREHNVVMRQRARERGLKLNEYGLFRGDEPVPCADEAAIHAALGLPYIPPELREDMGEFALEVTPRLVEREDLRGVVHVHSTYSDGTATIAQMAAAARERSYGYLVLADHSQSAAYAGGLTSEAVKRQHGEIDALNRKEKGFRVVKGIESDIRTDGSLDYDEDVLRSFEVVIASVHSRLDMAIEEATARVVRAVEHPCTTILGHPTGRLLLMRQGYPLDFDRVFDACRANRVAIEINANPSRLDLDWRLVRRARDRGVMLVIGPDAHEVGGLDDVAYGLGIARKGWLGPDDVLNTRTVEAFLAWRESG